MISMCSILPKRRLFLGGKQKFAIRRTVHHTHYNEVIMSMMVSQITSQTIVCSAHIKRKHQSSAALASVWGILWWLVNSLHKGPVTQKMVPFDDVIMNTTACTVIMHSGYSSGDLRVACHSSVHKENVLILLEYSGLLWLVGPYIWM